MISKEVIDDIIHGNYSSEEKISKLNEIFINSGTAEEEYLEWKEVDPTNKPVEFHISAFSFNGYGYIMIGVTNEGKIVGITRQEIEVIKTKISSFENSGTLSFTSWMENKKIMDFIKYHDFPVFKPNGDSNDKFLFIIEIHSKSAFIFIKQKNDIYQLYRRVGSESQPAFQVKNPSEFTRKIIEKYEMERIQLKIQEIFDSIVQIVKINYIDSLILKNYQYYDQSKRVEKLKNLIRDCKEFSDEIRGDHFLEIKIMDKTYKIPLQKQFNVRNVYDEQSTIYYSNDGMRPLSSQNSQDQERFIKKISDLNLFFQKYAQLLTEKWNFPIIFNQNYFSNEKELLSQALEEIFKNPSLIDTKYNHEYLIYLGRISSIVKFQEKHINSEIKIEKIEYNGKSIRFNGNNIIIEENGKESPVLQEILEKMKIK